MTLDKDKMREEFERVYTKNLQEKEAKLALERGANGRYKMIAPSFAWTWWQRCQEFNNERLDSMLQMVRDSADTSNRIYKKYKELEEKLGGNYETND